MTLWMFLRRYLNMHSLKYSTTHVRQLMFIYIEMFKDTVFISQPNSCAPRPYISLITVTSLVCKNSSIDFDWSQPKTCERKHWHHMKNAYKGIACCLIRLCQYICISKYVQIKSAYLTLVGSQVVLFVLFPDKPGKILRIMSLTRFVDTMFMQFGTLNDLARNGR